MKKSVAVLLALALMASFLTVPAAAAECRNNAQVCGTDWQDEYIVANVNAKDFGAKGDGVTDDTSAIQSALDSIRGGGVVYLPAGEYVVKGNLYIPTCCTLVGDWTPPTGEKKAETVLLAYAGRGSDYGEPFIGMAGSSVLKNISIFYPEQTADDIRPYPYTIGFFGVSCTVSGVTLYNSYNGINTHLTNGSAQHLYHIYGTPLNIGASFDINLEVSEMAFVDFRIDYWANSGRPGAPVTDEQKEAVRAYTRNGKGVLCGRIDDMYLFDIDIDPNDYYTGIYFYQNAATDPLVQGGSYGHMQKLHRTTVYVEDVSTFGVQLDFLDDIVDQTDISYTLTTGYRPTKELVVSVKDDPYHAAGDGVADDTAAIRACIEYVSAQGGGMVYIPAGQYKVTEGITVPGNVELRGVFSGVHTAYAGAVSQLNVYPDASGKPAVILQEKSGINGVSFWYPEYPLDTLWEVPVTVQGAGNEIWIKNTTFINGYDAIDLATNRCDRFYVGDVWGTDMRYGIRIGAGSDGGIVEGTLFTYGIWQETKGLHSDPNLETMRDLFRQNSIAYAFGDCTNFTGWSLFSFGSRVGTWFYEEGGKSAENALIYRLGLDTPWCETSLKIDQAVSVGIYGLSSASHVGAGVLESAELTGVVNIYGQNLWGGAGNEIRNTGKVNIYAAFNGFFSDGRNVQVPIEAVKASSEGFSNEFVQDNVRDQFRYTCWQPDSGDKNPSLTFTLTSEQTIRSVVISHGSARSGDWRSDAAEYTIQASTDGKNWNNVLKVTGNGSQVAVHSIPATTARYFRIVFAESRYDVPLEVADVKFLTAEVDFSDPDQQPSSPENPGTASKGPMILLIVAAVCVCGLTAFVIAVDVRRRKRQK